MMKSVRQHAAHTCHLPSLLPTATKHRHHSHGTLSPSYASTLQQQTGSAQLPTRPQSPSSGTTSPLYFPRSFSRLTPNRSSARLASPGGKLDRS